MQQYLQRTFGPGCPVPASFGTGQYAVNYAWYYRQVASSSTGMNVYLTAEYQVTAVGLMIGDL